MVCSQTTSRETESSAHPTLGSKLSPFYKHKSTFNPGWKHGSCFGVFPKEKKALGEVESTSSVHPVCLLQWLCLCALSLATRVGKVNHNTAKTRNLPTGTLLVQKPVFTLIMFPSSLMTCHHILALNFILFTFICIENDFIFPFILIFDTVASS